MQKFTGIHFLMESVPAGAALCYEQSHCIMKQMQLSTALYVCRFLFSVLKS